MHISSWYTRIALTLTLTLQARISFGKEVIADLVFWDQARAYQSVLNNIDMYTEVSPFWYFTNSQGYVEAYRGSISSYEDFNMVSNLKSKGKRITPTVTNLVNGNFDGALVSKILNDPVLRKRNVDSLVALTNAHGYDGIDLDYENLYASDRAVFTLFVQELASALHSVGKTLAVNVYGKISEPGTWNGPQAQDYAALGAAADRIRIMLYEYHWATSAAGPIAPITWVHDVLNFAVSKIPASKVIHGLPLYGYDWVGMQGQDLVWADVLNLANSTSAVVNWDSASQTPWFFYYQNGTRHDVWFENQYSIGAKVDKAVAFDVGGVFLWRVGGEDPGVAQTIRSRMPSSAVSTTTTTLAPPPTTLAPTTTTLPQETTTTTQPRSKKRPKWNR